MLVKLIKDYATTQLFANRHVAETPMDRIEGSCELTGKKSATLTFFTVKRSPKEILGVGNSP